jgi:hypothetical protein
MLFDPSRFVDQAFENSTDGFGVERRFGGFAQAIEQRAFACGIVDGHPALALVLTYRHHQPHALVQQLENLLVDRVDTPAQLLEIELGRHAPHPTHKLAADITSPPSCTPPGFVLPARHRR